MATKKPVDSVKKPVVKKPAAKPKQAPAKSKQTKPKPRPKKKAVDRRGAPKGRFGNVAFKPTPEQRIEVEAYVAAGAQHWWIAKKLGIKRDTLEKYFPDELKTGKDSVDWQVGGSIAQKALAGDPDMMKFYAARRAGWKTTTAVEASGPGGGPIEYRDLSDDEVQKRIDALLSGNAPDSAGR